MISDRVIFRFTGCAREAISKETFIGASLPLEFLVRWGNEFLCELEDNTGPTGNPEDYVLVTLVTPQGRYWECQVCGADLRDRPGRVCNGCKRYELD